MNNTPLLISSHCSGVFMPNFALRKLGINYTTLFGADINTECNRCKIIIKKQKATAKLTGIPTPESDIHVNTHSHRLDPTDDNYAICDSCGSRTMQPQRIIAKANHEIPTFHGNLKYVDWKKQPYSDLFVGSYPCQSFSIAGKRLGTNDPKGTLFQYGHDYIRHVRPRYFILENVKGLLSDDKPATSKSKYGRTFMNWIQCLAKEVNGLATKDFVLDCDYLRREYGEGMFTTWQPHPLCANYYIRFLVMNSKEYGQPQNRERIFIVGYRDHSDYLKWKKPKKVILEKRLKDVLETNIENKYLLSSERTINLVSKTVNPKAQGKFAPKTKNEIASTILKGCHKIRIDDNYIAEPKIYQRPRGYNSGGAKSIVPSITCNSFDQNNIVIAPNVNPIPPENLWKLLKEWIAIGDVDKILKYFSIRRLTPLECFRLMGLPDSFNTANMKDTNLYKVAGNGIEVNTFAALVKGMLGGM